MLSKNKIEKSLEKPRAGRNSRAIGKLVASTWRMTEGLWATKAGVCSYSLVTIWKGRELLCLEENLWSQCICYFSVAVMKHHNQTQNKKGRIYFGLWFQNKKTPSSCGRKHQSWWQEQETARSQVISIKHKLGWIYDFKAYTSRCSPTVSPTRDQVFYCLRLRRKILIQTSTVNKSGSTCLSSTPTFPYLDSPCCEFWCFEPLPVHMWVSRCRKELKRDRNHKILLIWVILRET